MIDLGKPKEWNPAGLKKIDSEVLQLAKENATTRHGVQSLRWYLLDRLVRDPAPTPRDTLEAMLQEEEPFFWEMFNKLRGGRSGALDDRRVGWLMGYETDSPVKQKNWKLLRDRVFAKIGLDFGPKDPNARSLKSFDIGTEPNWRYNVIRELDRQLLALAIHHAASDIGAQTIRWHIWYELVGNPREISLSDVEKQLENAEESLISLFSEEARRVKGHLSNTEVARMIGFRKTRPVDEGFYRQLREAVFGKLADGFGVVDLPELPNSDDDIELGKQGDWKAAELKRLDEAVTKLCRESAKTPVGAETLRWFLLDEITSDPDSVSITGLEQRICNYGISVRNLFGALARKRPSKPFISDTKIGELIGEDDVDKLTERHYRRIRERVIERIDLDDFEWA